MQRLVRTTESHVRDLMAAPSPHNLAMLGVPWDAKSSVRRGAADGPRAIRDIFASPSFNWFTESGRNLSEDPRFLDAGDVPISELSNPDDDDLVHRAIGTHVAMLTAHHRILSIGGDHAIAYPVIHAHARHLGPLAVVQIDAHPDLYDSFEGDPYSHACPFARLMETGLITRLVQIGIRAHTTHQHEQAARFGVEVYDMATWSAMSPAERASILTFDAPVYVSLDLDGLDPSAAPGVAHPEPGGLHTREVINIIQQISGTIIGAEVVELIPELDVFHITAHLAAKLCKELADRLLGSGSG